MDRMVAAQGWPVSFEQSIILCMLNFMFQGVIQFLLALGDAS